MKRDSSAYLQGLGTQEIMTAVTMYEYPRVPATRRVLLCKP